MTLLAIGHIVMFILFFSPLCLISFRSWLHVVCNVYCIPIQTVSLTTYSLPFISCVLLVLSVFVNPEPFIVHCTDSWVRSIMLPPSAHDSITTFDTPYSLPSPWFISQLLILLTYCSLLPYHHLDPSFNHNPLSSFEPHCHQISCFLT